MKRLERAANAILVPALIFGVAVFVWWVATSILKAVML